MSQQTDLLPLLYNELAGQTPFSSIQVGLSGGLDSVVLLHLLSRLRGRLNFKLTAVHVHHGLSPNADAWAEFCRQYCRDLNIGLRISRVRIDSGGLGWEAAARAERYRVFSDGLTDILALAHHRDDQIETFMLAALRGGGIKALSAMPKWRSLNGHTRIWRPLLDTGRTCLERYAAEHGLDFIEDESNQNRAFRRNWLRHDILPLLKTHIPDLDNRICANIGSLQQDLALLDELTGADYQNVCPNGRFRIDRWRTLGHLRGKRVLRQFLDLHGLPAVGHRTIADISRILSQSDHGRWQMGGKAVCAYRNSLFIYEHNIDSGLPWCKGKILRGRLKDILPANGFVLRPHPCGLPSSFWEQEGCIRTHTPADKIKLPTGRKSVKKILQERHVLPPVRKFWPVIANADDVCLAVANLETDGDFRGSPGFLPFFITFNEFITELNPADDVSK